MAVLGENMHVHPDGRDLAVSDIPQSVAPAIRADASHDLEIGQCAMRLRLLVAAGFAMMVFSASLAFDWWDSLGDYDTTAGYAGVAVFGLITGWLIWLLPSERGAVVIVTPYGIRDLRIGNEFLLWESIAEISTAERRGHRMIVLTPTPDLQRQLSCIRASSRAASRGAQDDRILISAEGLATDFETLLRACRECHAASDSRTASRRDRDQESVNRDSGAQGLAAQAS
ncbi:STM3941 family protein [Bradyrhizobium stylosanthis]|uniref:STM3941 family protein n=1 Tax=Bradyrhizobium stylosanthis TaxID=1803665 RepID=UPI0007C4A2ED|nr:STM3941 family protein [Bradyrhizobium stylosanthis]